MAPNGRRTSRERPESEPSRSADELDEIDKRIIVELQRDGRMPYTRLGEAVGLSEPAVRQRVNRLRESGVMQIVAVTDPMRGHQMTALVGVTSNGAATELAERIAGLEQSIYVVATAGSFDVLVEIVCADTHALLDTVNQIRALPGVRATETFVYLDFFKHSFTYGVS